MKREQGKNPFSVGYILENRWTMLTIVICIVILWMIGSSFIHAVAIRYDIAVLNGEKRIYQEQIEADSTILEQIKSNAGLERYARENFYMHGEKEEIFIIK